MIAHRLSVTLPALLVGVAGVAVNLWLFQVSILLGIVGLTVAKHVVIAYLCQRLGVNRAAESPRRVASHPVAPSPN